jgi:hypothetical protein
MISMLSINVPARVSDSLIGRGQHQLGKAIAPPGIPVTKQSDGIKAFHFSGDAYGLFRSIIGRDRSCTGPSSHKGIPH